uniref:Uncharacterized protein n=1 Tax=viral metagenome TaxID=1070528 RepID=A0A6C0E820_9ZZZZ
MSKPIWKPSKPATMEKVSAAVTTDYPALSPVVGAPKTTLNFKKTVEAAAARIEAPVKVQVQAKPKKVVFAQQEHEDEYEEEYEEQEFNADLINDRRRGDKGVW